ncbi:MAG: hypothetical protein SGILL_007512 [Bacillariaceae sp.]
MLLHKAMKVTLSKRVAVAGVSARCASSLSSAFVTPSNNNVAVSRNSAHTLPSTTALSATERFFSTDTTTEYETLSVPAPGSPFHYAFPVHSLEQAKHFYGTILACKEGRSSDKWQDYSLHGHQIVCHWVGDDYRCVDYYNPVDGDEVPVPHMGLALTVPEFHALAERLKSFNIKFIIEPTLRFEGQPGEQYTMFFKDPSGNNLEFKAMTKPENLFAKYNVPPE